MNKKCELEKQGPVQSVDKRPLIRRLVHFHPIELIRALIIHIFSEAAFKSHPRRILTKNMNKISEKICKTCKK